MLVFDLCRIMMQLHIQLLECTVNALSTFYANQNLAEFNSKLILFSSAVFSNSRMCPRQPTNCQKLRFMHRHNIDDLLHSSPPTPPMQPAYFKSKVNQRLSTLPNPTALG